MSSYAESAITFRLSNQPNCVWRITRCLWEKFHVLKKGWICRMLFITIMNNIFNSNQLLSSSMVCHVVWWNARDCHIQRLFLSFNIRSRVSRLLTNYCVAVLTYGTNAVFDIVRGWLFVWNKAVVELFDICHFIEMKVNSGS